MPLTATLQRSKRETENWRYTDLESLLANARPKAAVISRSKLAPDFSAQNHRLVFVNGVWQPQQSDLRQLPPDVVRGDLATGYTLALAGQTCLVTVPIELWFMTEGETAEIAMSLAIDIGPSTSVAIIEHHQGSGVAAHLLDTTIHLGAQAKLNHAKILHTKKNAVHLARTDVCVDAGAYYRNFALIKDTRLVRNEIDVTLDGKLAQAALNGLMLLRDHEHADTWMRITHAAPHGVSRQLYKSVVADKARGVFQGKIIVAEGADKTDGRQLSRALLLSDQAEMDAKPELEIYADDVACSHGSTVGDLDKDALFYLRARGIPENEARALLLRAFIDEVIDDIHMPDWQALFQNEVAGWLAPEVGVG